jgi:hypothetical protein
MAGFGLNLELVLYLQNQFLTESLGFLNPPHRQAAKRYIKLSEKFIGKHSETLQLCRSLENLVVFRNY